jgi:hypothetical protein
MRTVNFGALLLFGISLAALPAAAISIPKNSGYELPYTIQAANKNSNKPKRNHNYSSGKGFIPGYVPTPYGRGDCIGWWEPLGNGLFRCRGQFIPYRY